MPISPVGVEDPRIHIISVNNISINIAIELRSVVLLGASINSVNSEYRSFNLSIGVVNELMKSSSNKDPVFKLYNQVKQSIDSKIKKQTLSLDNIELKSITYNGIDYAIIYYLLIKRHGYMEQQLVNMNAFIAFVPLINLFDSILEGDRIHLNMVDLKVFSDYAMKYNENGYSVGSKLFCITRHQIENTTDLTQTIWKSMYINRILRNMSIDTKNHFFSPSIGWGLIRCVAKHIFTNDNLISQVSFGESINFIRSTSIKQSQVASELILGQIYNNELEDIKRISNDLKQATIDVDYSLGDLVAVVFYKHMGPTLYNQISSFIEESKRMSRLDTRNIVSKTLIDDESFKQMIFQYLYSSFLLAKYGIIHNDPHLNNVLITKSDGKKTHTKTNFTLSAGNIISIDISDFNLTIIDFDKSILSHRHTNSFETTAKVINEEIGIVFGEVKKTIASNYSQIFNCYVMYDVVRFGLIMKSMIDNVQKIVGDMLPNNAINMRNQFLDKMIKLATDILHKIYDSDPKFLFDQTLSQGSIEWLIMALYKDYAKVNSTKSSLTHINQISKIQSSTMSDKPEFISSRRKYADALKYEFISQYATSINKANRTISKNS